ncbi:sterol desaturase/sphingolipid hydroxylase (fatty acid hydroxylase superfamily) [Roseibium marinum]|uniref:Sterol desaturase/sphingolipid hydroxylase (Fatty acid hydroxylase superfamily) n=2 Tax=Roseibium marinum TaxID=281252 RepID=A0A2S3UM36_9HYPH|nr:sterol desaturase/sphingolipid hydroxylase (fatty acid hydroxylase superfamily) [Roseibium marinum]
MGYLDQIYETFLGSYLLRIAPVYVFATVVVGAAIYFVRERGAGLKGFFSWLFPRDIYLHASHLNDIKVFFAGRLLVLFGLFNLIFVSPLTIFAVMKSLDALAATGGEADPGSMAQSPLAQTFLVTVVLVVVADFCTYWVHRLHHEWSVFWPFHAEHHSAEVMTPITAYRKHPVYDLINGFVRSLGIGLVTGCVLYAVFEKVTYLQIGQANVIYVVFNLFGANFRHSHVWISYGRALEHILISPAQHQIHHSAAVEHHNKNYGEIFALWDWIFGSLYIPEKRENLVFGLADADGNLMEQPHPTLRKSFIEPVQSSFSEVRRIFGGRRAGMHVDKASGDPLPPSEPAE